MKRLPPLLQTGLDVVVAMLLAAALVGIGLVIWLVSSPGALPPRMDPISTRVSAGLEVDSVEDPRALQALELARSLAGAAEVTAEFELEMLEGVFLSGVYHASDGNRLDPVDAARGVQIWNGIVKIGPNALGALLAIAADPEGASARLGWLMPWMFSSTGLALLAWGIFCRRRREYPEWALPQLSWPRRVLAGLAVGAFCLGVVYAVQWLMARLGFPVVEQEWVRRLAEGPIAGYLTLLVVAGFLAPVAEEVFFRGHLFRHLLCTGSRPLAYGASALFFAGVHMNPSAIPAYLVYALILAWSYERWRTLWVPVIAHAVVNLTAVLTQRF